MIWIYTTVAWQDRALLTQWAQHAVEQGWAFCVQVLDQGVQSHYLWEGKANCQRESVVVFKTTEDFKETLSCWLKKQHPYDVPGIWYLTAQPLHEDYEKWALALLHQLKDPEAGSGSSPTASHNSEILP